MFSSIEYFLYSMCGSIGGYFKNGTATKYAVEYPTEPIVVIITF